MIYLIGQLAIWLLLATAFAALGGWAWAAQRAAPAEEAMRLERERLLRDLIRFTGDGPAEREVELDAAPTQRLLQIRDGRIAELERALETARGRTDELASELAELQRGGRLNDLDAQELARLRAAEDERARTVDAEVEEVEEEPVEDENAVLQSWRLRYFEQRVSYLEGLSRPVLALAAEPVVEESEAPPLPDWVAREATARAAFLEEELRKAREPAPMPEAPVESEPFAANADVDMLLRWRMLYLERRVAHLQSQAAGEPEPALAPAQPVVDPDRWKWRARYLESRVRHLEQRPVQVVVAAPAQIAATEQPVRAVPAPSRRAKPPVLGAARNGAPDDLTLIEGVSLLQQTTMYSLGVFHFDQIAAWSEENVAWVDQYLRLQGRIEEQEWLEQARELAAHGPAVARRALESEDA
ncbi:MAG: hypothetical protein JNL81_04365 [Hyphomonadaceae bacterium]|nr:hypothetical protein [Hyphomonadaceae bacterium]